MSVEALQAGSCRHAKSASRGFISLIVLLMLFLLMAGCSEAGGGYRSASHAASPAPARLTWNKVTFPPGSVLALGTRLAIPASNGNTAYVCAISPGARGGVAAIWVTYDRATHWMQTHPLPIVRHAASSCYVVVDDFHPSTALAVVSWSQIPSLLFSPDVAASFGTTDGGATWHAVADSSSLNIGALMTLHGRTYAQVYHLCDKNLPLTIDNDCRWHLAPLSDAWRIGQSIDQVITNGSLMGVRNVWGEPGSGAIWAEVPELRATIAQLWNSADGGAHWQRVQAPVANSLRGRLAANGRNVTICGSKYVGTDAQNPQKGPLKLFCSSDSGAIWHDRPAFALPSGDAISMVPWVITEDGTILQADANGNAQTLYRLTTTSVQWQSLGQIPHAQKTYFVYGTGALWTFPQQMQETTPALPLQDSVFVATYP